MGLATYTLSTNGQSTSNSGGDISDEWWTLTPEAGIGNSHMVQATIVLNQADPTSTIAGIFDQFVALSSNQTWSLDSSVQTDGISIFIQIINAFTGKVEDSATIELGIVDDGIPDSFIEAVEAADPDNWYQLAETTGTSAVDSGSAAKDLIYDQDASTAGYSIASSTFDGIGQAKRFDDPDPSVNSIRATDEFTAELNVNFFTIEFALILNTTIATNAARLVGIQDTSGLGQEQWYIRLQTPAALPKIVLSLHDTTFPSVVQNYDIIPNASIAVIDGVFGYVSITYDANTGVLVTKVNNIQVSSIDASATGVLGGPAGGGFPSFYRFVIGGLDTNNFADDFSIQHIQTYPRILADSEQTQNYNFWSTGSNP